MRNLLSSHSSRKTQTKYLEGCYANSGVNLVKQYMDESLAVREWLEAYYQEQREERERLERLGRRFDGAEPVNSW